MKDNEMEMVDLVIRKQKETHKHVFVTIRERVRLNANADEETIEDQACSVCGETRAKIKKDW